MGGEAGLGSHGREAMGGDKGLGSHDREAMRGEAGIGSHGRDAMGADKGLGSHGHGRWNSNLDPEAYLGWHRSDEGEGSRVKILSLELDENF
jgi:hypothetical protein